MIKTGLKFFNLNIWLDSTGDAKIDMAVKSIFRDDYRKTRPLALSRNDVQIVLNWADKRKEQT